jgi:hypothetical protein
MLRHVDAPDQYLAWNYQQLLQLLEQHTGAPACCCMLLRVAATAALASLRG